MDEEQRLLAAGRCSSLNETLNQLMEYVNDPSPPNRRKPRKAVNELIADLAFEWMEYGFYLGHRESYRRQRDDGEIPASLTYAEGEWEVTPECHRPVDMTSRIRRT